MTPTAARIGVWSLDHMHARSYLNAVCARDDLDEILLLEETNRDLAHQIAAQTGVSVASGPAEFLERVDAVIITSDNVHHAPLALAAARAGDWTRTDQGIEVAGQVLVDGQYELTLRPREGEVSQALRTDDAVVVLDVGDRPAELVVAHLVPRAVAGDDLEPRRVARGAELGRLHAAEAGRLNRRVPDVGDLLECLSGLSGLLHEVAYGVEL
mgnify:CR=1 FL=1